MIANQAIYSSYLWRACVMNARAHVGIVKIREAIHTCSATKSYNRFGPHVLRNVSVLIELFTNTISVDYI